MSGEDQDGDRPPWSPEDDFSPRTITEMERTTAEMDELMDELMDRENDIILDALQMSAESQYIIATTLFADKDSKITAEQCGKFYKELPTIRKIKNQSEKHIREEALEAKKVYLRSPAGGGRDESEESTTIQGSSCEEESRTRSLAKRSSRQGNCEVDDSQQCLLPNGRSCSSTSIQLVN